jgi:hypothetical protein
MIEGGAHVVWSKLVALAIFSVRTALMLARAERVAPYVKTPCNQISSLKWGDLVPAIIAVWREKA